MDAKIRKLIEICGFEEDIRTWNHITKFLFNDLTLENLCCWHFNRDSAVMRLIGEAKESKIPEFSFSNKEQFFRYGDDGRLITQQPFLMYEPFCDSKANVVISGKSLYFGEGVEIVDSVIRASTYVDHGARIMNSRIFSSKDRYNEANYIGRGATIEDMKQFSKSVVGSTTDKGLNSKYLYYHAQSLNGGIVLGGTQVSFGVGMQSHRTDKKTILVDVFGDRNILTHKDSSRTPLIIGTNCLIGDAMHFVAPSIIAKNHVLETLDGNAKVIYGLVLGGKYIPAIEGHQEFDVKQI